MTIVLDLTSRVRISYIVSDFPSGLVYRLATSSPVSEALYISPFDQNCIKYIQLENSIQFRQVRF